MLLTILKLLGDLVTAGSGMLGLLTEFKDKSTNKVTMAGKFALVGILLGFFLSAAMSVVEHQESVATEQRQLHQITHMTAVLFVGVPKNFQENSPYVKKIKAAFREAVKGRKPDATRPEEIKLVFSRNGDLLEALVAQNDLSPTFGDPPRSLFLGTTPIMYIYKGIDCEHLNPSNSPRPDWYLWSAPQESNDYHGISWVYRPDDSLSLQRTLSITIAESTGTITSTTDLPGSSLFIQPSSEYQFEWLSFSPAEGTSYSATADSSIPAAINTKLMTVNITLAYKISLGPRTGYCYTFPHTAP